MIILIGEMIGGDLDDLELGDQGDFDLELDDQGDQLLWAARQPD